MLLATRGAGFLGVIVACWVQGARCKVQGARCEVQGARCKVQGARCTVHGARWRGIARSLSRRKITRDAAVRMAIARTPLTWCCRVLCSHARFPQPSYRVALVTFAPPSLHFGCFQNELDIKTFTYDFSYDSQLKGDPSSVTQAQVSPQPPRRSLSRCGCFRHSRRSVSQALLQLMP
jgi:hypothetical protein